MPLFANKFSEEFSALLEKTDVSCYKISQYTCLDQAYLSRLKSGEKQNPSPETVMKISLALAYYSNKAKLRDIQKLFKAIGLSILTSED